MGIDTSAVARIVGYETVFKDLRGGNVVNLPQRIAVIGQGATASNASYDTTKAQYTRAPDVGAEYGYGSPLHLVARELFPTNGDGVGTIPVTFYPLKDDGSGAAAAGSITPSGTQTKAASYYVYVNGIRSEAFTVAASASVADICDAAVPAINAVLEMPVVATDDTTEITLTAKWKGTTGNDIVVSVSGVDYGTVWTIVQPTSGATNPSISGALSQIGDVWETLIINCFDYDDETILDAIQTWGEGRWLETSHKPAIAFVGCTEASVSTAISVTETRTDDKVNCQLVAPGSVNLPCVVAARQVARIAKIAQNDPASDYTFQKLQSLTPGTDSQQWTFAERDQAVKGGSSTVEVVDGVLKISNVVTMYAPSGEPVPAFRFVCDVMKLMNVLYNIDLIFAQDEWAGAPLIPDDQSSYNANAKKPKTAIAAVNQVIDALGLAAIISDPKTAKANTTASIDSGNPKRLNVSITVQLSGNTNIINVTQNFGFYFGSVAVAA